MVSSLLFLLFALSLFSCLHCHSLSLLFYSICFISSLILTVTLSLSSLTLSLDLLLFAPLSCSISPLYMIVLYLDGVCCIGDELMMEKNNDCCTCKISREKTDHVIIYCKIAKDLWFLCSACSVPCGLCLEH